MDNGPIQDHAAKFNHLLLRCDANGCIVGESRVWLMLWIGGFGMRNGMKALVMAGVMAAGLSGLTATAQAADTVTVVYGSIARTEGNILGGGGWPKLANVLAQKVADAHVSGAIYVEHLDGVTPFPAGFRQSLERALLADGVKVAPTRSAAAARLTLDVRSYYGARLEAVSLVADEIITAVLQEKSGVTLALEAFATVSRDQASEVDPNKPGQPEYYAWNADAAPPTRIIPINRNPSK